MNLQLSDGTTMQIPDDATPEAIRNYSARGEAHIKANPAPAAQKDSPYNVAGDNDPYSGNNTARRWVRNVVTGIPDLAIGGVNLALSDENRIPSLGQKYAQAFDIPELPPDASYGRHIGEGVLAAAPFGAAGAVREGIAAAPGVVSRILPAAKELLKNTVLPTVTSDAGARVGGAIGGEKGAYIGGLLGGAAPSGKPLAENLVQRHYTGKGDANAPAIAAAAERLGIEPTAGALGNYDIQKRENALAANYPQGLGSQAAREQQRVRNQMTGAGEDIAQQRGATGASVAQVGEDIRGATTDRLQADRDYSSAGQENLQRTVGDATQVPVTDIITTAVQGMSSPNATVPMRNSLRFRLENQLYPLINRHPDGTPILDANGNATVPYGALKGWRSDLGRSFEQGNFPRARELYEPATNAMGDAAQQAGVPRGDFNAVQSFTRGVEGPGGLAERVAPYDKEPGAAYNYTLEGGLKNPDRVQTFANETAGDPRQASVFGNFLEQKVGDTLGTNSAQGPNKFAQFVENADPRALDTIAGPQAQPVRDLGTLARGVNVPTSQRGLSTSTAGVARDATGKLLSAGVLHQLFSAIDPALGPAGAGLGYFAKPALAWAENRMMQSDAAKRGLIGAPMQHQPMSMSELVRILNIIGQSQRSQEAQ
jgi:hypothetical protein